MLSFCLNEFDIIDSHQVTYKFQRLRKIQDDFAIERANFQANLLAEFTEKFTSTPAVSAVSTLRRIRNSKSTFYLFIYLFFEHFLAEITEDDLNEIDGVVALIVTRKLFSVNLNFTETGGGYYVLIILKL